MTAIEYAKTKEKQAKGEYLTPEEVRAFTPEQVRENYTWIINSMSRLH